MMPSMQPLKSTLNSSDVKFFKVYVVLVKILEGKILVNWLMVRNLPKFSPPVFKLLKTYHQIC